MNNINNVYTLQSKSGFDKRRKIIIYTAVISIVILTVAGIITYPYYKPYLQYYSAKKCLNEGKYISALKQFVDLGDFKDALELADESRYNQAKIFFDNKEYDKAMPLLDLLHNYKDSRNLTLETKLIKAKEKYLIGDFTEAKKLLNNAIGSKDAQELSSKIDLIEKYQGAWRNYDKTIELMIKGFTITPVIINNGLRDSYSISEQRNMSLDEIIQKYPIDKKTNNINTNVFSTNETFYNYSSSTDSPKEPSPLSNPSIGMTSSEARNSTWGSPNKVNKTTDKYGVREQWVYSDGRYVYVEDGKVTTIQE